MGQIGKLIYKTIEYFEGDVKRINHFIKVLSFAKTISENENIDSDTAAIIEAAAVVHDIGIKIREQKYNSSDGKYQETEGPAEAEKILVSLNFDKDFIEKICYIIGHHHTYNNIKKIEHQIIVEADFLVNIFEEKMNSSQINSIREKIFKTKTGINLLEKIYL